MNSVFRLDSKMVDSSNLQTGLHRLAKRVDFDMRLTSPVRKKSGACFASVKERLANGSIRFHESLLDDVSSEANAKDLINLCIQRRIQAEMKLSGFLMAEQEGIYKTYFRPHHDGELSLHGKKYIFVRYQGATVMPYVFELPMRKGLHPIEIVYRFINRSMREDSHSLDFEWVRPDGVHEFIPDSSLYWIKTRVEN